MARATAGQLQPRTAVRYWVDDAGHLTDPAAGRPAVTRKQLPEYVPRSIDRITQLYSQRERTGFPEPTDRDGRTLIWPLDAITAWWSQYMSVERVGDGDELLSAADIAEEFGYARPASIHGMHANDTSFPEPDDYDTAARSDQSQPRWKRSTIWDYLEQRRFRRTRAGATTPEPEPERQ